MNIRLFIAFFVAIASVLGAIGCGGGSGATDSTAATPPSTESTAEGSPGGGEKSSKGAQASEPSAKTSPASEAQFLKQAEAICKEERLKLVHDTAAYVQEQQGQGQSDAALTVIKQVVVPRMEAQIEEIRAMGAPPREAKQVEDFLIAWQAGVEKVGEASNPGEAGLLFMPAAKLARALGLAECAYG